MEQWRASKCSSGGTQWSLRVLALEPSNALECECLRVGSRARSRTRLASGTLHLDCTVATPYGKCSCYLAKFG